MKLKQFIFAFTAMLLCFTVSVNAQVAKIGGTEYTTLADALDAAKAKTGDVTVELYEKVTLNQPLNGSFTTITFVGKDTDAEIYLDVQGYITATNKKVAFENLTLSKSQGGFIANAGFMNVAFGVYDVAEVTYTNCTFANGAYASSGKVTYDGCTFKKSWDKYGLWAYGNVDVTVQGSTFADYRGIKMYAENGADASVEKANLTVKNTNFSAVDNKPAIVLTYGESVVLEGNTYSSTGTFELDLDGKPNGVAVTSDVAPTCVNDNGACGVLVDGKIYTTVAQAAEVATAGSTVTLLHNSTETVKFPEGVTLNKNGFTANGVTVVAVAKIGDVEYATLQAALDAAAAGTGNVTVTILADVDLTGVDWNPVTVSAPGYPVVTVEGNGKTITDLNDMLFAGTWAGKSGLIIKNLTIAKSAIVNDKDDAAGNVGVGAFIGYPQASATITLENCHLKNSSVEGGHWTGGLIGMAGGYNGADGPVFMNLTIKGCSVTGSTITGKGSVGGVIGHGSCAAWTNVVIEETTVYDNTITSTGSSNVKAGAVMGTIGAAGQPTTVNGVTNTGGMSVSATVAENTVKSNGTKITTIYGRQGTETGMLYVAGGSYDNYPIEEGVAYAAPAKGYKIVENNGTYGIVEDPEYGKVAKVGDACFETLAAAIAAAQNGETITLIDNVVLAERVTIPADKTLTIDLNGKSISMEESIIATAYAINNLGNLTITDSVGGGSINARGIYNGYGDGAANVATAKIIVLSGTINAKGTNGGAAIFNYGVADIQGGNFTSIGGYSLNNQSGASMTIADGVTANNGIYASGTTLVVNGGEINGNRSGCHVLYAWNSAVTINGGTFYNYNSGNSTIMAAGTTELTINGGTFSIKDGRVPGNGNTWTSCLTDTQNSATMTVNGGTFNGGFRVQAGTTMTIAGGEFNDCYGSGYNIYGTAIVKGGTFTDDAAKKFAKNNIAAGYELGENGTVKEVTPAAVIGTQKYATLQAAIEAVKEGETITLLDNVNVTTPAYGQNALNHARAINFTLDLNGKTLSADTGNSVFRFNIANSGATSNVTLTIKNGKIVAGSNTWCAVMASGISSDIKAIMNLEDLTIEASKAGDLAVKAWDNATINAKEVTVNTTNAAGGFYAVGGEIILDDCTVNQKGLHTAPYLSMAFAVSTKGKMTINSGTYSAEPTAATEGYNQGSTHGSWVGGVMNSGGELIINGGTFSNGNFGDDALATAARSLIMADAGAKVEINGGTFNAMAKIVDPTNNTGVASKNAEVTISGGTYSADPTDAPYNLVKLAENYVAVKNNGVWNVVKAAAKIGTTAYATVDAAIKAAQAGETVTIFEGTYKVPAMKAGITVEGEGKVLLEGTLSGTLENLTLKKLHIKGGNAQRWAYGKGNLVFENVTFEATSIYALHFDGIAAGTNLTYKNCTIIGWAAMGGKPESCVFDGCTIKGNGTYGVIRTYFNTTIQNCTFDVDNVSTTDTYEDGIHAVEGAKVVVNNCTNENGEMKDIVNVHGASVVTVDGVEIKNAAKAGNKYYATFEEAFAAVQAGETLTLLADLSMSEILVLDKAITFDGNGKKLTSTAGRAINVSGADGVTIKNLTINASGERAINVIQNATNVTVENVTATAANYTVNVAASAPNAVVAIKNSTLNGLCTVNVSAVGAQVTVDNSTVNCNDNNTTVGESYAALSLNKEAVGGSIVATNSTINVTDGSDSMMGRNGAEDGTVTINGKTDGVAVMVAAITYPNSDNYHAFATLKAAIEFAKTGDVVTLIRDVTMDYNARDAYETQAQNVVIDGNGKTLTLNQKNSDWASFGLANNSKLVLNNMTIEKTGYGDTSGAWNTHAIIFSCPVEMSNVTVYNAIAVQAGATLNNVTINEANGYYGLWINGNGQEVTIKGGAINANNGGRGIKIADQYIDAPAQVTLNVTDTKFTTAKKAAVLVSSKAGANITASNVDIANVAEDSENFVWVDEDWAQYFANVEVTGATVRAESAATFTAAITANGAVQAYYKTLAEAIAASTPETGWGGEVTLLKNVTLEGGYTDTDEGLRIEKSVTINGAGYTIDCGTFKKGIRIYQNGDQASNVMFKHVNIVNNNNQGRCIDTRSAKINLMLNGFVNLTAHGTNSQPLTIGGSEAMTKVTISGGTIDAGTSGYGVICFVPVTNHINVQGNAVIKGLAAFYLKEGVTNTAIKLSQSTSIGTNKYASASGVFGAVVIEGSNNAVRLEHSGAVVKAVAADGAEMAAQAAFLVRGEGNTINILAENAQVITEGKNAYRAIVNTDVAASAKMIEKGNELKLVAENRGYQFYSFEEAVRFAGNEGTIKVVNDFELAEVWTVAEGQNITLDLNGKTLSTAYVAGSTTNHLYAIHNYGELTITDSSDAKTGKISARGIFNYGNMTLTSGTINAIDGNGGYGVRNYAGATFTMNGGTIATTYEDGDVPGEGYDASPVRVDEGATFTMNDGVINNVSNYTVAIDNYGTTIINGGKATTIHTTLANSGTMIIEGGEFTCNGLEGITAHALWAADGTTTINGGTFNGKDNYNGFNVDASEGAVVTITGGTFLPVHSGSLYGDGTITVSGGTFFDKISDQRCELGFQAVANEYGTYTVKETGCRNAMTIVDGEVTEFVNEKEITVGTLTYTRGKIKGTWTPFYVPFAVPVSALADKFDVAYINDVRRTDSDNDGELDKFSMEVILIHCESKNVNGSSKTLKANYPYFIRSKSGQEVTMEIALTDAKLYAAKENVFDCTTMTEKFEIKGNYNQIPSDKFGENDYVVGGGVWGNITPGYPLNPFRFYMTRSSRDGSDPTTMAPMKSMKIVVCGEEDENGATIIYDIVEDNLNNNGNDYIYDLQGRRVSEPKKGGIYIKNGKKILF